MSAVLCFTIRFLDPAPTFNGKRDGGEPEWPPSPLRLFQALVDASASRWRNATFVDLAKPALEWFQKLKHPALLSPEHQHGVPFRFAVPNNDLDVWAGPISKGTIPKKQPNELKTMKLIRPTHLRSEAPDRNAVHYLFELPDGACPHFDVLQAAARSITHLGWGVDMVAGNAELLTEEQVAKLTGERWVPSQSGTPLRIPKDGTLADLMRKHEDFLGRLSNGGFKPVLPLREFDTVCYRRATEPERRPIAAFEIHGTIAEQSDLPSGKSRFRPFHATRKTATVAGMLRHAAAEQANSLGWTEECIKTFVCGHGDEKQGQATTDHRLMYLPLPSITPVGVQSIRRVLVVGPSGSERQVQALNRVLNGSELIEEGVGPVAMLSFIPPSDPRLTPYLEKSAVWSTVSPVILPGYDDPGHLRRRLRENRDAETQHRLLEQLHQRTDGLLRKALTHAGLSAELVSGAELEWREVGFRAGTDPASCYVRPERLGRFAAVHVRVRFANAIPGPLAIGAGRYRGMGLFASESR